MTRRPYPSDLDDETLFFIIPYLLLKYIPDILYNSTPPIAFKAIRNASRNSSTEL